MVTVKTTASTMKISIEVPHKAVNICVIQLYNSLHIHRTPYPTLEKCVHLLTVVIFTIARKLKQPKYLLIMYNNTIFCQLLRTMKYTGKWMAFETIIQNEVTQSYRNKCFLISFISGCYL